MFVFPGNQSHSIKGECVQGNFICLNKNCIPNSLMCNGKNDCGDNSDENECSSSPCKFGTCSQVCVTKKRGNSTFAACNCHPSYTLACTNGSKTCDNANKTCVAKGKLCCSVSITWI